MAEPKISAVFCKPANIMRKFPEYYGLPTGLWRMVCLALLNVRTRPWRMTLSSSPARIM